MPRRLSEGFRRLSREAGLPFLARRKGALAVAGLALALALAANTIAFAVLEAFLLASFAVPEADRLYVIAPVRELPGRGDVVFSDAYPNYQMIRETQRTFAEVTAMVQSVASWEDGEEVRPLRAARVTASFFPTMRVAPRLGRVFEAKDEGVTPAPVVLISEALWKGALRGDPAAIGRTMRIDGTPCTVVGVLPPGFALPLPTDVWLPFSLPERQMTSITGGRTLTLYGRLADGASSRAAQAEVEELTRRSLAASPDNRDFRYTLQRTRDLLAPGAERAVLFAQAGAFVLLLLAVSNLASLLVAWGLDRRQEMAVHLALGAPRRLVLRMVLLQTAVVVAAGSAAGVALTAAAMPLIRRFEAGQTLRPFLESVELDARVLVSAVAFAALACGLASVLPSRLARRAEIVDALRASSRGASASPMALRWQKGVVVVQATLSVVLLSAAVLVVASFRNVARASLGFAPGEQIVARVQLAEPRYPTHEARAALATRLLESLAAEPELAAAAFTTTLPLGDVPWGGRFFAELPDRSPADEPLLLQYRRVSPAYLSVMGIPLLRGRDFDARDDAAHPGVVIVSRAIAERLWPGEEAIGRRLFRVQAGGLPPVPVEVVGVAGDVLDSGYAAPPGETAYVPFAQVSVGRMSLVVTPRGEPAAAVAAVRRALRAGDPTLAASDVAPLAELVGQASSLERLQAILTTAFAIVALGLVVLGSYGVMVQLVASRERDLATRLVLGASPLGLGRGVLAEVARLTLPGVALGLAAVQLAGGALRPFVFGVDPRSGVVMAVVAVAILALALVATLPAAWRASRVDLRKGF